MRSRGATLVEYVVVIGIVALGLVGAFASFGKSVSDDVACFGRRVISLGNATCADAPAAVASASAPRPTNAPVVVANAAPAIVCVAGGCTGGDAKPVDPAFTLKDLEHLPLADQLGIVDYWVRLTNTQRAALNGQLELKRLSASTADVPSVLRDLAREAIAERRNGERDPSRRFLLDTRGDTFANAVADSERRTIERRSMMIDPMARGGMGFGFDAFRPAPVDPRALYLGQNRPKTLDQQVREASDRLAGMMGIRDPARDNEPDDGRFLRVPTNLLKGLVGRTPLAFAFDKKTLEMEKSPDELFRDRLLANALERSQTVEIQSNGAGTIVVRPGSDPAVYAATETLLEPASFALVDVAAQRERLGKDAKIEGDGQIAEVDLAAVLRGDYPAKLKRAAAVLRDPATFSEADTAANMSRAKDGLVSIADLVALRDRAKPRQLEVLSEIAPRLVRVWVPDAKEASGGKVVEVDRWSPLGQAIAMKEADLLARKITIQQYTAFLLEGAAKQAADAAADARKKLQVETDALLGKLEELPGTSVFQRSLTKEINAGINDRLHEEYVNRAWYEKLGVGTWGAVKEVLMIPVGLGELVVYVSDHANVVVWVRGRPEGGKLLWQITGQELTAIGPGIGAAFEDWWASAQSEPDRAVGQTIGFVGSFFIPVSKLSKVTRLTSLATKALDTANKLKAAGRFEEAVVQIDRASRYAKELEAVAKSKTATAAGKAATEESKLEKLSRELNEAVQKSGDEIDAGGRTAAATGKTAPIAEAGSQCFTAGTPVRTEAGSKMIEAIVPGDVVVAVDVETNAVVTRPVVRTFARPSDHVRIVRTRDGPEVSTTDEHPFFVQGKGFVAARLLERGDHLVSDDAEVVVAETERREVSVTVYNFEVAGAHTYFVGAPAVLVHNLCVGPLADADRFLQVGAPSKVHLKVDPGFAIESAAGVKIPARHVDLAPTLERIAADTAPAWKGSEPLAGAAKIFPDRASSVLRAYPVIVDGAAAKNVTLVVDEATGESWLLEKTAGGGAKRVAVTAAIRTPPPLPVAEVSIPKAFFAGSPNSKLAAEYADRMAAAAQKGKPLFEGKPLTTAEFQETFRQMHAAAKEGGGRLIVDEVAEHPEIATNAARNGRAKETDAIYKYLDEIGSPKAESPAIKDVASAYSPGNFRGHQYPVYAGHGQYWESATRSLNRWNELAQKAERAASPAEKAKLQTDALNELADFTHTMANLRPTAGSTNFGVVMAITNQALVRLGRPPIYAGVLDLVALRTDYGAFRKIFVDHVMGRINLADEQKFENLLRYLDKAKRDGVEAVVPPPLPMNEAAAAAAAKAETPAVTAGLEALRESPSLLIGEKIKVLRTSGEMQDGFVVTSIERRGDRILVWASKDGTKRWQTLEDVATHNEALVTKLGDAVAPRVAPVVDFAAAPEQLVGKTVSVTRSTGAVEAGWSVVKIERRGADVVVLVHGAAGTKRVRLADLLRVNPDLR